jgi:hypothetical protein
MPDDGAPSYWELRRLYGYVLPPILGVWGVYTLIKGEFHFGETHFVGAKAVVAGLGLIAAGALVLALLYFRDQAFQRHLR